MSDINFFESIFSLQVHCKDPLDPNTILRRQVQGFSAYQAIEEFVGGNVDHN